MPTGRFKFAQDAFQSIAQSTERVMPEYVVDPTAFFDRIKNELEKYPSAIPYGAAGVAGGALLGIPVMKGAKKGWKTFLQTAPAQQIDDLVRAFSRTPVSKLITSKEYGLDKLRPFGRRTFPMGGAAAGGAWAYDIGRQHAEHERFGPSPNKPYVYIPMQ